MLAGQATSKVVRRIALPDASTPTRERYEKPPLHACVVPEYTSRERTLGNFPNGQVDSENFRTAVCSGASKLIFILVIRRFYQWCKGRGAGRFRNVSVSISKGPVEIASRCFGKNIRNPSNSNNSMLISPKLAVCFDLSRLRLDLLRE